MSDDAIAAFVWSTAACIFVAVAGLGVAAVIFSSKLSRVEERAIAAGARVRFLCAIPEQSIEAGELGRVYMVYPGDDLEYWISPDRNTAKRVRFYDYELWQLELVDE